MGRKRKKRQRQQLLEKIEKSKHDQMIKKRKREEKEKEKISKRRHSWYQNRKIIRQISHNIVSGKKKTPHPLVIISSKVFETVKHNTIVLQNMKRNLIDKHNITDGGITEYEILSFGNNVSNVLNNQEHNKTDIPVAPLNYLLLVCKATEICLMTDYNICYTSTSINTNDYVLLLLCTNRLTEQPDFIWDNKKDFKYMTKFKKSTVKKSGQHHYGSSGHCFSFGIRNSFVTDNNQSSITSYAGDQFCQVHKYKTYIWNSVSSAFKAFNHIIPGISSKLNMTCRSMIYTAQNTPLHEYFHNRNTQNYILSGYINVNAKTTFMHCEQDTTYTTIVVPKQKEKSAKITFQFQINQSFILNIIAHQGTTFTYSAYCLSHRQLQTEGLNCMNISTYSGKRVYCNYKKSYHRIKKK